MNSTISPHDKFFKLSLQEIRVAKDFFTHHLPEQIKKQIDLSTLHLESESFIDKDQQAHFSDVLYSVSIDKKPGYVLILTEHQSSAEVLMPFRILKYMCLVWDKHIKRFEKKQDKPKTFPIIYPLIFYHGRESPYPYSCDFLDCFDNKWLAEEILHKAFHLIDTTQIPDEELLGHGAAALFEVIQKNIFKRNIQVALEGVFKAELFQWLGEQVDGEYLDHVIKYVINQGELQDIKEFFQKLIEALPDEERKIMTIAEQLRQEGMQKGVQQGMQQGFNNAVHQFAKNLLAEMKDLDKVAQVMGLSRQELEKILH